MAGRLGRYHRQVVRAVLLMAGSLALAGCSGGGALLGGEHGLSREVPGGDPQRGQQAIERYQCGACHDIPGVPGARGMVGPPLGNVANRSIIGGRLPNTPDNLSHWIQDPQGVDPGNAMPNLGVSAGEARDMTAYLYSLH
jgi:cytochrome c2